MNQRAPKRGVPGRFVVLAIAQMTAAVYCAVTVAFVVAAAANNVATLFGAGVLTVLTAVTLTLLPRSDQRALYLVLALTAMTLGFLTGVRVTAQGQLAFGLFLLMLSVWIASYVPTIAALALIAFGTTLYLIALVFDPLLTTPLPAVAMVVTIAFSIATVLHSRRVRSHYEMLVDASVDVVVYARNGAMTWVSPVVEDRYGWTPSEFVALGESVSHPDDSAVIDRMRRELAAGQTASGTYRLRTKTGDYCWVEARLTTLPAEDGGSDVIGSLRDVDDRVTVETRSVRRLQEVSHELRTPLTVIRGPLERHLRRDKDMPDALRVDLEAAVRASRRMENLVDDVLDGAREAPTPPDYTLAVDVARLTADCVRLLQPQAATLDVCVDVDERFPPALVLDSESWITIVTNLVSNAIKYTALGGVTVRQSYDGRNVVLAVSDTGRGIPEADLDRIFERFYVSGEPPERGQARSGLGLSLVAAEVNDKGGEISVLSVLGKGSTFTVTMPAAIGSGDR